MPSTGPSPPAVVAVTVVGLSLRPSTSSLSVVSCRWPARRSAAMSPLSPRTTTSASKGIARSRSALQRFSVVEFGHSAPTNSVEPETRVERRGLRHIQRRSARTMTRGLCVPWRSTSPVPARTTTRSMCWAIVWVVVRLLVSASLTPTAAPQTTSSTPDTSRTSLGVDRAIGANVVRNRGSAGTATPTRSAQIWLGDRWLPASSLAVMTIVALSVLPAYLRATDFGILSFTAAGAPAATRTVRALSLIAFGFFLLVAAELAERVLLAGGCSVVATVTVAASPQLTLITSGFPEPPPPGSVPLTLIVHDGGTLSTNVASAVACGSTGSRVPSLLKSTKTVTLSVPAFVPGSVITAAPLALRATVPDTVFGPAIE